MTQEISVFADVVQLSDTALVAQLKRIVNAERAQLAKLLVHLGELDARGLYREDGYSSMFEYAVSALGMSESEAYLRIQAARLTRRFPLVMGRIESGELNLTALKLLAPHLTDANCSRLLDRVRGMRKREVELLVVELAPKPDVPERVRQLPAQKPSARAGVCVQPALPVQAARASVAAVASEAPAPAVRPVSVQEDVPPTVTSPQPFALQPTPARVTTTPLRPGRYKLELTIDQGLYDKIQQLRELLRHSIPDGDLACVFERAVSELTERQLQKRFAQKKEKAAAKPEAAVAAPRERAKTHSRYVPRAVVREVYERDQGQCSFVSQSGQRCSARGFLELHHHETPFARGGTATADNLRLMCRAHNALQAERDYGRRFMQDKLGDAASRQAGADHLVQNDSPCDPPQPRLGCITAPRAL
jgi:hypothetical protein